jgi:hypothetical protein
LKKNVYKNIQLDEEIEEIISNSDAITITDDIEHSDFKITGDSSSNLKFEKPKLSDVSLHDGYLDKEILGNPFITTVLKNYIEQSFCLRPESIFQGIIVKNNSLKVLDKSSYGLYSDYICSEARNFSFNTRNLRKSLTSLFLSFDRLSVVGGVVLPLEIDYGRGQDTFFVQFSCNITPLFKFNLLLKSIIEFINFSDCIEISFCEETKRIVVRNFWIKGIKKKWTSVFIYGKGAHSSKRFESSEEVIKTHLVEDVTEELVSSDDEIFENISVKKQWSLIRLTLNSILALRDEYAIAEKDFPTHFNNAIVSALMNESTDENTFDQLEDHEKEIVIQFINEEDPLESLKRMRRGEMTEIEPEEYINSIYSKVEDIEYETLKKISGDRNIEAKQTVKGTAEEKPSRFVIKGAEERDKDNKIWEIKKLDVAKNLKSKYSDMKNPSPQEVEETFEATMREVLSSSDSNIESYVSGVVDSISEELLPASVPNSKFINKTMSRLKNRASTTEEGDLDVSPLELKLILSFTEKLIRKGESFEENLKFESGRNDYLKKQVDEMSSSVVNNMENPISAQMRIAHDKLISDRDGLIEEKNKYKSRVFELERKLAKSEETVGLDRAEDKNTSTQDLKQEMINKLTASVQGAKAEALDLKRQLRLSEKDMIKLKTQMARLSNSTDNSKAGPSENSKSTIRIKQLEKINDQYLSSKTKMEKELSEKKSEIHKAKLESKTMANKLKQAEKKLEVLNRRKAS